MNVPLSDDNPLVVLQTIDSTQDEVARRLRRAEHSTPVVLALEQTAGRGRHGRRWHSPAGECLAVSIALLNHVNWPRPELLGMAMAIAAARALECRIIWPNDLVLNGRKLGGVLGELISCSVGRVPVVGVGANLNVTSLPPEIADSATSLVLEGREPVAPEQAARAVLRELQALPEPFEFASIAPHWFELDETQGKRYKLPDGRVGKAVAVSEAGHLIADVGGHVVEVPSAEAWGLA